MDSTKISAVIITFNEEKNIRRCLESLQGVADEIVVVDSISADKTRQISSEFGVNFFEHAFEGHIQQKNYAIQLAANQYVLSLDADEALSPELKNSILELKNKKLLDAYSMNRLTNYCGSWINHCGWYPDKKIRLWNKDLGAWGGENPHDTVIMKRQSTIGHLKGDLLHYSFYSISEHIRQLDKFTNISSLAAFKRNKKVIPILHIVVYPFFTFLKMYFIKLGFLDGLAGFLVCISGAYYKFSKYSKLHLLQKSVKTGDGKN
jgi:glycosyltransferase involved in cell wall biosynthesis